MRSKIKIISLILVITMLVTLLAGCASTTEPESSTANSQSPEAGAEASTPTTSETPASTEPTALPDTGPPADSQEPETEAEPEAEELDYSVCWRAEDGAELSIFWPWPSILSKFFPNAEELPFFQSLEELTNVHMNLMVVADDVADEKRNLLIAAEELPDICSKISEKYTGGLNQAVEDQVVVDIKPYLEEYSPLFYNLLKGNPAIEEDITTDGGYIGAFVGMYNQEERSDQGYWVRQDWLDNLNMSTPQTPDQFYNMLKAFQTEYGCTDALSIVPTNFLGEDFFCNAFSRMQEYRDGDEIRFGFLDNPEVENYLKYMNKLYSEGLINQDFMSYVELTVHDGMVESGNTGMFKQDVNFITNYTNTMDDKDLHLVAIAPIVATEGAKSGYLQQMAEWRGDTSISYNTEKLELAMRWYDTFYSEPVTALANYGTLGVTYNIDENGRVQYTELVTNNEQGMPQPLVIAIYGVGTGSMAYMVDLEQKYINYTPDQYESHDIWKSVYDGDYNSIPRGVSDYYSTEETALQASLRVDIETAMSEAVFKLITGAASFDNWESIKNDVRSVGADRQKELSQKKYNEWLADQ